MKKIGRKNSSKQKKYLPCIYIPLLLFIYFFAGCKPEESEILSLTFDVSGNTSVPLSEIADHVDRIQLETKEGVYLKNIRQVELFENHLLVKDVQAALYVFDMYGNFVRTIGKAGQGPGEYTYCLKFALDPINKRIFLKTNAGVMVYDLLGNFIEKYDLKMISDLYYYNDTFYSVNDKYFKEEDIYYQDTYFSIYDSNCHITDSILTCRYESKESSRRGFNAKKNIMQNRDNIYVYNPPFREGTDGTKDTLFLFKDRSLQPIITVNLIHSKGDEVSQIFISERYTIIECYRFVKESPHPPLKRYTSQCIYDTKSQKGRYTKNGFMDDFHNSGHIILLPLIQQDMFYSIQEGEFSEEYKMELNPVVYIGQLRK